jgi:RNA polymerase sigma-70 factor (family 1)
MSALSSSDEKELLLLLSAGDSKAFELLYHQYKDPIYSNLLKLVRTKDTAEEVLQDVFYKVWANREQLADMQSFSGYLYRMSANRVTDFYRRAAQDRKLQEQLIYTMTELYDHVEESIDYKESNALLEQAISALPPQRKLIFNLCKIEGKSYEEVGQLLGISTSTINSQMVKASKSIKEHLLLSQKAAFIIVMACLTSRF